MSTVDTPAGLIPIFAGWNVWAVEAKKDLDFEALMVGVPADRRLRIFVEEAADAAPGVAVGDPANPLALKGSQVEILGGVEGLDVEQDTAEARPGALPLWTQEETIRKFVRFYNRGSQGFTPWPSSSNFFLATVFTPSGDSPLTNGAAPGSLAGTVSEAVDKSGSVLKVVAIVAGVGLGLLLISKLASSGGSARSLAA